MTNKNFHGAFIFRNQGYGILSGTYLNINDPTPYPETANLQKDASKCDPFIGIFETIWLEKNDHYKCSLIIKQNTVGTYDLEWSGGTPSIKPYKGLGIIENEMLVGCYW